MIKAVHVGFLTHAVLFSTTLNLGRVKPKFMLLREMGYYFHIFSMSIEIKLIAA